MIVRLIGMAGNADWRELPEVDRIRQAVITLANGRLGHRRLNDAARLLEGLVKMSSTYKANRSI